MTLVIELTKDEETKLRRVAKRNGLDISKYARQLLGLDVSSRLHAAMTEAEWVRLEDELSDGIDPGIPPIPDEALSRASMYGHRA